MVIFFIITIAHLSFIVEIGQGMRKILDQHNPIEENVVEINDEEIIIEDFGSAFNMTSTHSIRDVKC